MSYRVRVLAQAVGAESNATLHLQESATNSGNHSIGVTGIPIPSSQLDDVESPRDDALLWMDIEGYEGHALKGASHLLESGMPVICEFNPKYLQSSGGMKMLLEALEGRNIYDLAGDGTSHITIHQLEKLYEDHFTDILAITTRTHD